VTARRAIAYVVGSLLLAACQSPSPPAAHGTTTKFGNTTVTTGGSVRVEGSYVN
jgi:hypothetical protein